MRPNSKCPCMESQIHSRDVFVNFSTWFNGYVYLFPYTTWWKVLLVHLGDQLWALHLSCPRLLGARQPETATDSQHHYLNHLHLRGWNPVGKHIPLAPVKDHLGAVHSLKVSVAPRITQGDQIKPPNWGNYANNESYLMRLKDGEENWHAKLGLSRSWVREHVSG